ncbi:histidine kinase [Halomonas sp. LR3S48]|uniref:nitric oxide-sensing protein NosP n=1 Tax=Halomonas sp. LR3S48 TaxID=2982694 RepID=UPI0021E47D2C|nr:nitric oxide-sensing protein NosP [Halomonas sp. LR3S48]UYG02456.1 histidine kinase [Halomonas sp. LR3S48]
MSRIRSMQTRSAEARVAVQEFHQGVIQDDTELVMFFCSSHYDLAALADEMNHRFGSIPVVGCTTAGEIGPLGYRDHTLAGVSFPTGSCTAVTGRLDALQQFSIGDGQAFSQSLLQRLEARVAKPSGGNSFGFLLIDGLSVREEQVARTLQTALGDIVLVGGSAGDDLRFAGTWVFHDGAFHSDSAVLTLLSTDFSFRLFKTQHFLSLEKRLVVTRANAEQRIVHEINGMPAAEAYAELIGVSVEALEPSHFAAAPVVVLIDGTDYVRSIQKAEPDGSLIFYSAIDEGLVLRVAKGVDLVTDLEATMTQLHEELGPPQLVLACDCILRNLEITQKSSKAAVEAIFGRNHTVGFSTYGEQYGGVHVNQTLTGVAIGTHRRGAGVGPVNGWGRILPNRNQGQTWGTNQEPAACQQSASQQSIQVERLHKMIQALMDRAERSTSVRSSDFSLFQTAVMLEDQVRTRTRELEVALRENEQINHALQSAQEGMAREIHERRQAQEALEQEKEEQRALIRKLEEAHNQLLQSEKLASIGQLAAGVAHEINNPIGFVNSNLNTLRQYADDLLRLLDAYEAAESSLGAEAAGQIAELKVSLELDYLREDIGTLIAESIDGTARVRRIVQDLRDFSRTEATDWQFADLHQGLESTLNVAANEIKYKAEIVREYGELPAVECLPAQLNQVFLNFLVNAAQAIEERGTITVRTGCEDDQVWLAFADNGAGIPDELQSRIFDPFFTTKPVGQGTGLGLSLSYGIVQKHGGRIDVVSRPGEGTTFTLWLPIRRATSESSSAIEQPQ